MAVIFDHVYDRDLLEKLKAELDYLEAQTINHAIGQQVMDCIHQISLSCMSEGPGNPGNRCSECPLLDFVPRDRWAEPTPCRFIGLNQDGETIQELFQEDEHARVPSLIRDWLTARIADIEARRPTEWALI